MLKTNQKIALFMRKVTIYLTSSCPYCLRAKSLLQRKNIPYTEINIENDSKLREDMLTRSNGRKTVPQIFIDDYHVGGCDDLYALNEQGKLEELLASNL